MCPTRAVVSLASILLGTSTAFAQQREATTAAAPPVFQGIMVDAKGKTVGRLGAIGHDAYNTVVRQIGGIWVEIPVDVVAGFVTTGFTYWYQSSDCTGQAYLSVNFSPSGVLTLPAYGAIATVPPATEPSIYFAGAPTPLNLKSYRSTSSSYCAGYGSAFPTYVGLPQSVPVSSLGLTLPFSIK